MMSSRWNDKWEVWGCGDTTHSIFSTSGHGKRIEDIIPRNYTEIKLTEVYRPTYAPNGLFIDSVLPEFG